AFLHLSPCLYRRFKNHRKALVTSVDKKIPNGFLEEQGTLVLSPSPSKRYFPIPLDSLEEEYRIRSADDGKLFREEFNSLPCYYHHGSFEEASREHNREKNRYPNILPYDHSRVVLSHLDGHLCSDYINASYIDGYKEKNKFIAAQGPKPETVADFWRMIWEQKTTTIVMLTNLKERKEEKCYQYWPEKGCWMYGNIRVALEDVIVLVDYTIRKFCVQYQGSDGPRAPRLVTQLHFTSWPDFGVPFSPIGMLKFLKKVKAVNPSYAGPIVVHCSAGVGRTGTFIVIDSMIDMMHIEQRVDVFGFVSRIREQRCQLIQTDMQYSFIYQALLEYYLYGDTELDVCSLEGHLQRLHNTRAPHDRLGLEEEFRKLTNVRIMKENMRTGNLPANMKKNRVLQIIPCKDSLILGTLIVSFTNNAKYYVCCTLKCCLPDDLPSRATGRRTILSQPRAHCLTQWRTSGGWCGSGDAIQSLCSPNSKRGSRYSMVFLQKYRLKSRVEHLNHVLLFNFSYLFSIQFA
uniref:protein-tyrosine-phosphatase n=1 Tax=Maylandia zebra TaxID=106582 RepID=A0A3P9DRZ0_9CICH